jgi:acetyl esterase/lipase
MKTPSRVCSIFVGGVVILVGFLSLSVCPALERPVKSSNARVQAILDIPYAGTDNPRQCLDLSLPKDRLSKDPLPVIVFVHGGGWRNGNKRSGRARVRPLVESGRYAGVSVGYRLSGEARWPAQIHDCKAAIRWIRANAKTHGLDPQRIGVWGTSAGGHLVAMLGTSAGVPAMDGDLGPHTKLSTRVTCVVDFFGPTDFLQMDAQRVPDSKLIHDQSDSPESLLMGGAIQSHPDRVATANPITYVDADDPPFLIMHGDDDRLVPIHQSVLLDKALCHVGVDVTFVSIPGAGHGLRGTDTADQVTAFLDRHLRQDAKLAEALRIIEKTESYSHFLEVEKALLPRTSDSYRAARRAYILSNYVQNRQDQNPRQTLKRLMKEVNNSIKKSEQRQRFSDAAWTMGMMLLEDHPSFEVSLDTLEVHKGIVFAKNPELEMELDLFLPKARSGQSLPCIVCIHGGGWRVHRRAWFNGHAAFFATQGFAAVSIDYRMFPAIESMVACIEDCKAAVRWIRAHAETYGIDPERIGAVGGSAGAHLCAMLATTAGVKALEGSGGHQDQSSVIQAAVGYCTPVFNPEKADAGSRGWLTPEVAGLISPYVNVDRDSAPILLIHGNADKTVPIENSRDLHAKYQSMGAYAELMVLEGKPHVFYTNPGAAQWAFEFFEKQFTRK